MEENDEFVLLRKKLSDIETKRDENKTKWEITQENYREQEKRDKTLKKECNRLASRLNSYLALHKNRELIFKNFFSIERNLAFLDIIDDQIIEELAGTNKEDLFNKFYLKIERRKKNPPRSSFCSYNADSFHNTPHNEIAQRELDFFNQLRDQLSNLSETFSTVFHRYITSRYERIGSETPESAEARFSCDQTYLIKLLCAMFLSKEHFQGFLTSDSYRESDSPKTYESITQLINSIYDRYVRGYDKELW